MTDVDAKVLEWALTADEDEIFRELGSQFIDGAGRFPPEPVIKFGRALFESSEAAFRAALCGPIRTALGRKDSDMVTAIREVLALSAITTLGPEWAHPIAIAYVVALMVRKMADGFCDDCDAA